MATEAYWVAEEKLVVARWRAMLEDEARCKAEVEELEKGGRLLLKWRGQVEGKWLVCNCCMTQGFKCQLSGLFGVFLSSANDE